MGLERLRTNVPKAVQSEFDKTFFLFVRMKTQ